MFLQESCAEVACDDAEEGAEMGDHPLPSPSSPGFSGEASPKTQFSLFITKSVCAVCVGFCSVGVESVVLGGGLKPRKHLVHSYIPRTPLSLGVRRLHPAPECGPLGRKTIWE